MIRLLVVAGALLELAVARVLPEAGAFAYVRLAAALVVLLLPGALIAEALGRRSGSATLVWALAAVFVALAAVFALGSSLDLAFWILGAISLVALVLARRRERPPRIGGSAIALGAGTLFGIALWHVAGHVDGDALFHLGRVRKLVAFDELSLGAVNEFADGGLHPGYAFPLWHGFLALLAELAAVDPEVVVLHGGSVLAPLAFLVAYEAGATLFASAWMGGAVLAAQVGQLALAPGHGGSFATLAQPSTMARPLLVPAVLTLVFAYVREPAWPVLGAIGAGALALSLIHPTYVLFLAVPLGGFLAVRLLWERRDGLRFAAAAAAFLAPTGAALLWLLPIAREAEARNPSQRELRRAFGQYAGQIDVLSEGSYRLAPEVIARGGTIALAALALVPLAALAARRLWAAFVLGGSLAVLALMLVPELFVRLSDAVSLSQSRRAAGFLPFAFAFAGGLAVLARPLRLALPPLALAAGIVLQALYPGDFTLKLEEGGGPGALAWWAALGGAAALAAGFALRRWEPVERPGVVAGAAALLFVVPLLVHAATTWTPSESRRPNPLTPGLVEALRERVPERRVVFSDLETSYRIAAYAPVYVAAGPPAHVANTEKNRPYERRRDVIRFFRTGDLAIPRRYGARFLVVDRDRFRVRTRLREAYRDGRYALYEIGPPA